MKELVYYIDLSLYVLIALTVSLILYKALALYLPQLLGKPSSRHVAPDAQFDYMEFAERGLAPLASIASSAPFIGLTGTVMHIILALEQLSSASIDITLISGPIAHALNSTLLGLGSAIPALIAYNLLVRRVQIIENRFEASALLMPPSDTPDSLTSPTTSLEDNL